MNSDNNGASGGGNIKGFDFDDETPGINQSGKSGGASGVKKIFKIIFVSILVAVWAFILLTIYLRSDDDILETPILSDEARAVYNADKDNFIMYRIYTQEFMTGDGSLQLSTAVYAESAHEFEIGVRIAWTQLRYCEECDALYTPEQLEKQLREDSKNADKNESYEPSACMTKHNLVRASLEDRELYYTLTDSEGNVYPMVNRENRTKSINFFILNLKYEYERISFSGLYFDIENNIINRTLESSPDESSLDILSSDGLSDEGASDNVSSGISYYLNIYDKQGGNLLFSACVYNNYIYINRTSFEYPDGEYID